MPNDNTVKLIDRTISQLRGAWRDIAARVTPDGPVRSDLPGADADRVRRKIAECLRGRGGEVSARARAADLGRLYLTLDGHGRIRFLQLLAREFGIDPAAVDAAIAAWTTAGDDPARERAERRLRRELEPPRQKLLRQFNILPNGIKFLVDMRGDILQLIKDAPELKPLDRDLRDLLSGWFDIGFLDLRRIDWRSPAALLEKLIDYEAVHEIRSWSDLKNRLDSDRRCFAFFHNRMPDEPLIFVEVALIEGMADNIHDLLDEAAPAHDPRAADTAIFYSISNAQIGLKGISFGNFLIKRVVDRLRQEFPGLKVFATLSPMPGFRDWLDERIAAGDDGLLAKADAKVLADLAEVEDGAAALAALLDEDWWTRPEVASALRGPLLALGARYLLREKSGDRPRDPVTRFHLLNGARIERINWLADTSERGLARSAGMMVNYLYRLDEIEENHEAHTAKGAIAAASTVKGLARRRG